MTSTQTRDDFLAQNPARPLTAYIEDSVKDFAKRPALDFMGRRWTYAALGAEITKAARAFRALGVGRGVPVGLHLPNLPYYPILFFAVLKAGGTVVNYSSLYTASEIATQIEDSGTKIMVSCDISPLHERLIDQICVEKLDQIIICPIADVLPWYTRFYCQMKKWVSSKKKQDENISSSLSYRDFLALGEAQKGEDFPKVSADDNALIQYTSGTTGTPKGAVLTHCSLSANLEQMHSLFPSQKKMPLSERRFACILPFFHIYALMASLCLPLREGALLFLLPKPDMRHLITLINRRKITVMMVVPTVLNGILQVLRWERRHPWLRRLDQMRGVYPKEGAVFFPSLKICLSGGAPLSEKLQKRFEEATGTCPFNGYGLTETGPTVSCPPLDKAPVYGSSGTLLPGTQVSIRSTDDVTQTRPPEEPGEILVKGPQVMTGYWQRPEETEESFVDGYFRTGDVGYQDAQGHLYITDRLKDIIIRSGYNIYPAIIEKELLGCPGVDAAAVVGHEHTYQGEVPIAFIVSESKEPPAARDIRRHLRGKLSKVEMPARFEFCDELPKTAVGKIDKKALRARCAEKKGKG